MPTESYTVAPRSFGSNRGARKHAGCDLYAKEGSRVFAMADGEIMKFYEFYEFYECKQENVWEGVEYFCLQKAAARQTRTAFKFVSIIEPHRPLPSFSRTRESIYPRAPSSALG
ncbi:hypothetical protein CIK04_25935 [Vibrio sp. 03_296]|nr:hypothetical protein CIK04_25935 [Vibrio sp. 03_296]